MLRYDRLFRREVKRRTPGNGAGSTQREVNATTPETVKYKSVIAIGTSNDLPSNAPYGNNNIQTAILTNSTFSRLVDFDSAYNIIPCLASS